MNYSLYQKKRSQIFVIGVEKKNQTIFEVPLPISIGKYKISSKSLTFGGLATP